MLLKLGIAKRDITPAIGTHLYGYKPDLYSESLHDALEAAALVFGYGGKKSVIVSATVCLIKTELADEIRCRIEEKTGIPADHILLEATHTHSGPNVAGTYGWGDIDRDYCDSIFIPQIIEAVREADRTMVPVRIGVSEGESRVGINRRERCADNRICLGQNPWGCFNPKMVVLSFRDNEGNVVGNIIHYGVHGTAAGEYTAISRDWPGVMTDALQTVTGGLTVFLNGPEGDVGPRLSNGRTMGNDAMRYVEELGQEAAEDAIRIYRSIKSYGTADMDIKKGDLSIPLQNRISLDEARNGLEKFKGETVNIDGQLAHYYETVLASYQDNYKDKPYLRIPQWILKLGNIVFVSFGFEVFSEIGLRIQKMSDCEHVLCLSNTNGSYGYFSTESEVCMGGYEVTMYLTERLQPFEKHADWFLVKETIRNMDENLNGLNKPW